MTEGKQTRKTKKKPLTVQEFASLGGKARAKKLTKQQRKEIASGAASARWKDRQE